ncbi:MAG: efflux RND transporter permease subunit [Microscillaceae bacterium]|nr:efflux RND transporter permease subunit [Microscillaceae bacterium]
MRASFLVMVAIPLSFLLGLILADLSDFGLQFMSIAGLIIALGLLVDNAIVVVENVYQFIKEGFSRTEAALRAVEQVGWSITSSTITTVLAFLPLLNIKSLPGEYIKSMPLTLIYTLVASLLVALTFTPFLSSRILQPTEKQRESWIQLGIAYFIRTTYRAMLAWVLSHRWLTLGLAFLALAVSAALIPLIGLSFFPRDDAPVFAINITAPQGTILEETDRAVRFVEALLDQQPGIDYYLSNTGYGNPRVINVIRRTEKQTFAAQVMVFLKDIPFQERDHMIQGLRQSFAMYSQADIELKEALLGPPLDAQISIKLYGGDLREVKKWAAKVEQVIRKMPGTVNIYNPLKKFKNKLQLEVDELAAANLAVPLAEIAQNVRIAVSGTSVSEFRDGQRQLYDLYVQMQRPDNFVRPSDVAQIYVPARTGQLVPLSQLARLSLAMVPKKSTTTSSAAPLPSMLMWRRASMWMKRPSKSLPN